MISHKELLQESIEDLQNDFDELLYLVSSQHKRLETFKKDVDKIKEQLRPSTYNIFSKNYSKGVNKSNKLLTRIQKAKSKLLQDISSKKFETIYEQKLNIFEEIRLHYSQTASFITSLDWQSPSYLHSRFSMAGKQTGKIVGTENDYKRDQHSDAIALEKKFRGEYIDSFFKLSIQPLATNSGMAAFTSILNFLRMNKKITGPVLIGKNSYFENKTLVTKMFEHVIRVDENDTQEVLRIIKKNKPSVIFLDSLSNTKDIVMPNLTEIISYLLRTSNKNIYLIIDNTGLSVSYQILKKTIGKSPSLHTIVFESLNKYYQFGMDRVTGGILWIQGKEGYNLFRSREYSGTIISDTSAQSIPMPNRKFLTKRLARLNRNAQFLAEELHYFITNNKTGISTIIYPGLPNHTSYSWNRSSSFFGSFFTIEFEKKLRNVSTYKKFIQKILEEAKQQKVNITAGTSFGFNTTRIYLTALHSEFGNPFVRVAVGTEPQYFIEKVKNVFIKVLKKNT